MTHEWWDACVGVVLACSLALNLALFWLAMRAFRDAKVVGYRDGRKFLMDVLSARAKEVKDGRQAGTEPDPEATNTA